MNPRHQLGRSFVLATKRSNGMPVAFLLQRLVSEPTVGVDHASRFHRILDEGNQTPGRGVGNPLQANAADTSSIFLSRNPNQGFLFGSPTAHAFLQSAQIGFIDLHCPGQPITARPDHRPTELVKPSPSLFVTPQAQDPLQTQGAGAVLLGGHPPHSPKPQSQRAPRVLEDRPGGDRGLMTARPTLQKHAPQRPVLLPSTPRTAKPVGPPEAEKILAASLLGGKPLLQPSQVTWVVFHSAAILYLVVPESRGHPDSPNCTGLSASLSVHGCSVLKRFIQRLRKNHTAPITSRTPTTASKRWKYVRRVVQRSP